MKNILINFSYFAYNPNDDCYISLSLSDFLIYLHEFEPKKVHCIMNKRGVCIYQSWYLFNRPFAFAVYTGV